MVLGLLENSSRRGPIAEVEVLERLTPPNGAFSQIARRGAVDLHRARLDVVAIVVHVSAGCRVAIAARRGHIAVVPFATASA